MDTIKNILTFKRMLTPWLIQCIFWILVLISCIMGMRNTVTGYHSIIIGLLTTLAGIILSRIICEYFIVMFQINETLMDIKERKESNAEANDTIT